MKRSYGIGLIASAVFAFVTGSAEAQTTASGPYYAIPSWDQQLPASTRFVVLSNWVDTDFPSGGAAVLDRETGLVWQRAPAAFQTDQSGASLQCNNDGTGRRSSWRLPSYQELASLFEYTGPGQQGGKLPTGHPFQNLQAGYYWTYTLYFDVDGWLVDLRTGRNVRQGVGNPAYFWCVRSGMPGALNQ